MSSRAGLRLLQSSRLSRPLLRRPLGRRYQTADAAPAQAQTTFQRLWNSPVGVKTVHFWAPVMKWCLVLAGISDFTRPAESLSLTQNLALMGTGAIWTRWCLIIKPRNILLAAVNFFLGCVGLVQVSRIFTYQQSLSNQAPSEIAEGDAKDIAKTVKDAAEGAEAVVKKAVN